LIERISAVPDFHAGIVHLAATVVLHTTDFVVRAKHLFVEAGCLAAVSAVHVRR
jgi:hypothetical protein